MFERISRFMLAAALTAFAAFKLLPGSGADSGGAVLIAVAVGELLLAASLLGERLADPALVLCWFGFLGAGVGTVVFRRSDVACGCLGPSLDLARGSALLIQGCVSGTACALFLLRAERTALRVHESAS